VANFFYEVLFLNLFSTSYWYSVQIKTHCLNKNNPSFQPLYLQSSPDVCAVVFLLIQHLRLLKHHISLKCDASFKHRSAEMNIQPALKNQLLETKAPKLYMPLKICLEDLSLLGCDTVTGREVPDILKKTWILSNTTVRTSHLTFFQSQHSCQVCGIIKQCMSS
jgi:hypothetical protein